MALADTEVDATAEMTLRAVGMTYRAAVGPTLEQWAGRVHPPPRWHQANQPRIDIAQTFTLSLVPQTQSALFFVANAAVGGI